VPEPRPHRRTTTARLLVLSTVTAVLAALLAAGAATPAQAAGQQNVRFATYNILTAGLSRGDWGDNNRTYDRRDSGRMAKVGDTIARHNLSVVALQEAGQDDQVRGIQKRLKNEYGERWKMSGKPENRLVTSVRIIWDTGVWQRIGRAHWKIPMGPGQEARNQTAMLLENRASGQRVWFLSVHLANKNKTGARKEGARRTLAFLKKRAVSHRRAFVIGGDFNDKHGQGGSKVFAAKWFTRSARWSADERVADKCTSYIGHRSGPRAQPSSVPCRTPRARQIDQVYVSTGYQRGAFDIPRHRVIKTRSTVRSSDHLPVAAVLDPAS